MAKHDHSGDNTYAVLDEFLEMCDSDTLDASSVKILIQRALSHPDLYCGFDEILATKMVSEYFRDEVNPTATQRTLELFSYGSTKEYYANRRSDNNGYYLPLTSTQRTKLERLSVVSVLSRHHHSRRVSYRTLEEALVEDVNNDNKDNNDNNNTAVVHNTRTLEDLLISCLYAGLIVGKLDQPRREFVMSGTPPGHRDVPRSALPDLVKRLQLVIQERTLPTQMRLSQQIEHNNHHDQEDAATWLAADQRVNEIKTTQDHRLFSMMLSSGSSDMDLDPFASVVAGGSGSGSRGRGGGGGSSSSSTNWRGGRGGRGGRKWGKLG